MWPFSKPQEHKSCAKHHVLLFLAGAAAFNTLDHIFVTFSGTLPIRVFGMEYGQGYNMIGIIVSALITAGLLYAAKRVHEAK